MTTTTVGLALCASVLSLGTATAQKAKFKNERATCQKIRLPGRYVEPEDRVYAMHLKGAYAELLEPYSEGLHGWSVDVDNPQIEAVVSIYGYTRYPAKKIAEKREKRDKDGNVTDRWTEYAYEGSAVGKATLYVYGESAVFDYTYEADEAEVSKKRAEKEAEEKAELEANPFLSEEDLEEIDDEGESDISEDSGLDNATLPIAEEVPLDVGMTVRTGWHLSSYAAYEAYREREVAKLQDFRTAYPAQAYKKAIGRLNAVYGYSPVNHTLWLRAMKSDKHPDYEMWNNACQAAEKLLGTFEYNESIAAQQAKFDPIVGYFRDQLESTSEGDKKAKKLRKAAFTNLSSIMYYLDRYEDVVALCDEYGDSKLLDGPAKRMRRDADRQAALLAFHGVESRHFDGMQDLDAGSIETVADESGAEEDDDDDSDKR